MEFLKKNRWIQVCAAIAIAFFALGVWQAMTVQKAHTSLAEYAAFRGCRTMTTVSDATATCMLANGQGITMVHVDGKWYLAGDLPVCYFGKYCW